MSSSHPHSAGDMPCNHFYGYTRNKQDIALGSYIFISTVFVVLVIKCYFPNSECLQSKKILVILNLEKNNGNNTIRYMLMFTPKILFLFYVIEIVLVCTFYS